MASQIISLAILYSTVYSDADQGKHQSSASLAFLWGIHRWPVNSRHKGPVTRKIFPFDDVIMFPDDPSAYFNIKQMDIYVSDSASLFRDYSSLFCRRNVSLRASSHHSLMHCIQPVQGSYVTLRNDAYEFNYFSLFSNKIALKLCEVKLYTKGR